MLLALTAPALAQDQAAVHGGPVRALAVAPEGGSLASAGFDQSVIFWDLASGRARAVVRWHGGAVNALAPLADGAVVSGGEDGRIAVWSREGRLERTLLGHNGPIAGLAARDGVIASASWDGTVRVWAPDGRARVLEGHQGNVNAIVFRADGVPMSAGFDGTVRAWRADRLGEVTAAFGLPQNALAALPDGGLAVGGVDGTVRVIAPTGTVREVLTLGRPVVALAVNGSGTLLAAGSLGGSVAILALPEGRLLHTLEGPGTPVWSAAFDSDGRTLWTGGADRRVRRWDALAGRALGPAGEVEQAALPDGLDPHGARVFRACAACHALTPEGGNMAGPTLHGLFGRRMGSVPGYAYSERLARRDIVWTPETVADLFTRGPDVVTPGTTMPVQRLESAEDMEALLRFLEHATR
ncbi:c-type cytochrome [Neoroseomonas alba]|uniref:c-type cytochrome n=1 Tax=Roseomonas alba TaxID=2846776 RepID=UPI00272CC95A|nr:c-type cytochrome [Neoroseomonas alba]